MREFKVIAIDGPAGSGKSTTAKLLAERLGFTYLDTGAMYRCVTLTALDRKIDLREDDEIGRLAGSIDIGLVPDKEFGNRVYIDGLEVTSNIRTPLVDANVSLVSSYKEVRERMVALQRKFAERGNVVAEGRDIATVVFPDADLKIFLTADLLTRAKRRCHQMEEMGQKSTVEEQMTLLSSRDLLDSGRAISPLKKDPDAVELDTSGLTISEQVERAYQLARERLIKNNETII
jgi:CMP/dCMP kinase